MAFGLGSSRVIFTLVYLIVRSVLGLLVVLFRRDLSKDAELLVLRHENAVLRRHVGRVRYEPADRGWLSALARLIPRRRWSEVFPVTPATLLAWHRKLAAKKYDTSKRRKPGRPPTIRSIARLAVRLAKENPLWGSADRGPSITQTGVRLIGARIPRGYRDLDVRCKRLSPRRPISPSAAPSLLTVVWYTARQKERTL